MQFHKWTLFCDFYVLANIKRRILNLQSYFVVIESEIRCFIITGYQGRLPLSFRTSELLGFFCKVKYEHQHYSFCANISFLLYKNAATVKIRFFIRGTASNYQWMVNCMANMLNYLVLVLIWIMTCDWSQETWSRNRKFVIGSNSKLSWFQSFQIKVETEKLKSIFNLGERFFARIIMSNWYFVLVLWLALGLDIWLTESAI